MIHSAKLQILTNNRRRRLCSTSSKKPRDRYPTPVYRHRPAQRRSFIFINNRNARIYGSQGQQRSCALSLKLAEADILEKITDESPIILLDDVMSELDDGRQELLLERLGKRQVFITCCDPSQLLRLQKGKAFEMTDGSINEI